MRMKTLAAAIAGTLAIPSLALAQAAAPAAPASPHTFAPNIGVVSDYLFRGVSQTHGKPALQGGLDYSHASGLYLGIWGSTITWVKDGLGSGTTEVDIYGGYKNSFAGGDWNYDVGYITYNYPGHGKALPAVNAGANPNTAEVYGSIGWKWLSAKYSYVTSSHFIGWNGGTGYDQKTSGSNYLELNANYDLGDGWTLIGHVGQQKVKNYVKVGTAENADYTDWKLGVSKDVGFGTVTLAYSTTDAKGNCGAAGGTSAYCWANGTFVAGTGSTTGFKDVARGTAVLSFVKTF